MLPPTFEPPDVVCYLDFWGTLPLQTLSIHRGVADALEPEGLPELSPGFTRGDERKPWVWTKNWKVQSDDMAEAGGSPAAPMQGAAGPSWSRHCRGVAPSRADEVTQEIGRSSLPRSARPPGSLRLATSAALRFIPGLVARSPSCFNTGLIEFLNLWVP